MRQKQRERRENCIFIHICVYIVYLCIIYICLNVLVTRVAWDQWFGSVVKGWKVEPKVRGSNHTNKCFFCFVLVLCIYMSRIPIYIYLFEYFVTRVAWLNGRGLEV